MNATFLNHHWLDHYLPPPIRLDQQLSRESRIRARTMVAVLGLSVIIPLLLLITYGVLHLVSEHDFSRNITLLIAIEVLLVSQHLYFHSYGNLRITAGAYSAQFLLINTACIFLSGGLAHSPLLPILLCAPMIAFMTISYRAAVWHTLAVILVVITLMLLDSKGVALPDHGRPENYHITQVIVWTITLLILNLQLFVSKQLTE